MNWEPIVAALGIAACFGLYYLGRWRARRNLATLIDVFPIVGAELVFWASEGMAPLSAEIDIVQKVRNAIGVVWREPKIWFVRTPTQKVGFRTHAGIAWNKVPLINGTPATGDGYGGLEENGAIWIATYHEGRDPVALLVHEAVHLNYGLAHGPEMGELERKIMGRIDE